MKNSKIEFTEMDFYQWIGALYIEKKQFEKAANLLSAEVEKLSTNKQLNGKAKKGIKNAQIQRQPDTSNA